VVSLGGTITMTTQASGGIVPSLTSKDLLATLALAEFDLEIEPITLKKLPGAHLTPEDLVELAANIDKLGADGYAGVVVTQGPIQSKRRRSRSTTSQRGQFQSS
jgi:L-asparaginase